MRIDHHRSNLVEALCCLVREYHLPALALRTARAQHQDSNPVPPHECAVQHRNLPSRSRAHRLLVLVPVDVWKEMYQCANRKVSYVVRLARHMWMKQHPHRYPSRPHGIPYYSSQDAIVASVAAHLLTLAVGLIARAGAQLDFPVYLCPAGCVDVAAFFRSYRRDSGDCRSASCLKGEIPANLQF